MRILIAEDDSSLAGHLRKALVETGHAVDVTNDGENAWSMASTEMYDLIILDIMLPKRSGLDVLARIRKEKISIPVLLLTARDRITDKVSGLDLGADDYMTKPFVLAELLARVRALGRRKGSLEPDQLSCGDLTLDPRSRKVLRGSREINLTAKEFSLLRYLMRHQGTVVTHMNIMDKVWDVGLDMFSDVVKVVISRLRKKLEIKEESSLIHTVRGIGYIIKEPSNENETGD